MLQNRTSSGDMIPNPEKFPNGFKHVADFIHGLGLKSGLYTAKGFFTCGGFAASCNHEAQDAALWASWGIDYAKDDSCSSCGNKTDDELYHAMYEAIQASGREMVLTVEGAPDNALCSAGGCGNAKRVGHDINPNWMSMVSLVDIASGLWPFAHNSSNPLYGGWWSAWTSAARARRARNTHGLLHPPPSFFARSLACPLSLSLYLALFMSDDLDMMCVKLPFSICSPVFAARTRYPHTLHPRPPPPPAPPARLATRPTLTALPAPLPWSAARRTFPCGPS